MKKTLSFVAGLLLMVAVAPANGLAQDVQDARRDARDVRDAREDMKRNVQDAREDVRDVRKDVRKDVRGTREDLRDRFKKDVEAERDAAKVKIQAARDALKAKISTIRDAKKKDALTRIGSEIEALNARFTNRAVSAIDKMAEVVGLIVSRTAALETHGVNVSAVRADIVAAENVIAAARTSVAAQAAKVYSVPITTEDKLRSDVSSVRKMLHNDLSAMHKSVSAAHAAVREAGAELAKARPVTDKAKASDATSSAPTSSTP